ASVTDFPEWVRITPNNVPLTRGIAAQFALSVSPDANTIPGARRGNISILVKTEDGNEFSRLSIPVSATLLKLDMRKDVETVLHPGGEFEVEIGKPIEPSVTLDFKEVKKDETGKIKVLRLESKGERLVLIVSVAEDAEESQSELILEVAPKEYKVKSKSIRINALVRASPKLTVKPQEVVLAVEKGGDYEAKLELLLDHYENVELESTISDLIGEEKHKLSANAGEVKVTEKLTLEPGKTSELKLDFLVSPDIHSGVYKGEATLTLKYHKGERQTSLKVPIKLEIKK
ncbi:MAG: hypothetical protein N2234_03015, partial [Planctomycetota bacterium]|nr:hypothetical protein [Planctomycetota bacterium]